MANEAKAECVTDGIYLLSINRIDSVKIKGRHSYRIKAIDCHFT